MTALAETTSATATQRELFSIEQVQGFSTLSRRERLFAQALLDGCSQTEAARRAGVAGTNSYIRKVGTVLARKPAVRAVVNQAWALSGANLDASLRRTAAIAQRGFAEWEEGATAAQRAAARAEWRDAEALLASIHARLGVKIEGEVSHHHGGIVGTVPIPAAALSAFAEMRRDALSAGGAENENAAPNTIDLPSA